MLAVIDRGKVEMGRTSGLVGAASLSSGVVAVDFEVLGSALSVAGTASLLTSVSLTANGLLWLVSRVVLATNDAEQLLHRHLHERLVGFGLSSGVDGERESREGGERFCEHSELRVGDRRGVLIGPSVSINIGEVIAGEEPP